MEKKNSQMYNIDIKNTKEIYDFCLLNKIMDIDGFINKCFKKGFNIEKYGLIGEDSEKTDGIGEKQTEIEVIREIRVEVPVEVIKYVDREVIKEIKVEVPVEKIVYIYDKKEENSVPNIDKIRDKNEINEMKIPVLVTNCKGTSEKPVIPSKANFNILEKG